MKRDWEEIPIEDARIVFSEKLLIPNCQFRFENRKMKRNQNEKQKNRNSWKRMWKVGVRKMSVSLSCVNHGTKLFLSTQISDIQRDRVK